MDTGAQPKGSASTKTEVKPKGSATSKSSVKARNSSIDLQPMVIILLFKQH